MGVNIISGLTIPPPTSPNGRGVFVQALSRTLTAMSLKLDNQVFHLSELYVLRKKGDMAVITKEEK